MGSLMGTVVADVRSENLEVTIDKRGADRYEKVTYPIRYGRYTEIRTPDHLFEFNLNGEIKYIRGLTEQWPHPVEWLKRTDANDWVYYTTGAYNEVFSFLGEYYRPCLPYPSNSLWEYDPFSDKNVKNAIEAWVGLAEDLNGLIRNGIPGRPKKYLDRIRASNRQVLRKKAQILHRITGSPITVLPPDTRHVDYDVIPLMIADGCLYQCGFCSLKSERHFQTRTASEIRQQIRALKQHYGDNLRNYNAVYLGNHEALAAGREKICMAAEEAYTALGIENSYIEGPTLYLFGSVDSMLQAKARLFDELNRLPYYSYINIGLESAHAPTLADLEKPVAASRVEAAFDKMIAVNRGYHNLEVTANFIIGEKLSGRHYDSLAELVTGRIGRVYSKGALYLSPLNRSRSKTALQKTFIELKQKSRLPTFVYLIQRL
jgi:hypothetical protein